MNTSTDTVENPKDMPRQRPVFDDLGDNAPSFEDYFTGHVKYVKEVQSLMSQALDDEPGFMDRQAREAESHNTRMRSILGWADSYLDVAEHQALVKIGPRDSSFTDMDREKALKAAVARQRRFRDVVKGICDALGTRISYAQTRLRTFAQAEGQKFT